MASSSSRLDISIVRTTWYLAESRLDGDELAKATRISRSTLQRLVRLGLVEADQAEPDRFSVAAAARLDRMLRLHHELEVDLAAAAIIVDLLDRLDRAEAELDRLRRGT